MDAGKRQLANVCKSMYQILTKSWSAIMIDDDDDCALGYISWATSLYIFKNQGLVKMSVKNKMWKLRNTDGLRGWHWSCPSLLPSGI